MTTKPVIFLDFDGVLNNRTTMRQMSAASDPFCLEPTIIARLNRLVRESGADIVVSSTWRLYFSVEDLRKKLADHGATPETTSAVVDKTPDVPDRFNERTHEVSAWLNVHQPGWRNRPDGFVVIDDTIVTGHHDRQVLTTFDDGMTDDDVETAMLIMRGEFP